MQTPDFENIAKIMEREREKFSAFARLLSEYNKKFNLTAITEPREVEIKHFADSLAGERYFPQGARVAEVGSGGGFPSVPLMIARRDLSFTLIESTAKKCAFLRTVNGALGLGAEIVCARAEDVGRDARYRETFDVAVARAVARLDTLAEYCLPLVKKGGLLIAYKGNDGETEGARGAIKLLGGGDVQAVSYELPAGMGGRCLIFVRKERPTPSRYPRGNGKERREPLS